MEAEYTVPVEVLSLSLARDILELWPKSHHLQELINTVEVELKNNSDKAIDAAKCLIEAVCKTILKERGVEYSSDSKVPGLVKMTLKHLGIEKNSTNDSVRDIATGFDTAVNGIANIRNNYGPLAHGRDAYHQKVRDTLRHTMVRSVEMVAIQLIELHVASETNWEYTRLPFEEHSSINYAIDKSAIVDVNVEESLIEINGAEYRPSQILYEVDRRAYVEARQEVEAFFDESENMLDKLKNKHSSYVKSNIISVKFVQLLADVYLQTTYTLRDGGLDVRLENTSFISGPTGESYFLLANTAQENADKLMNDSDAYSIARNFDVFTEEAVKEIMEKHNE